MRAVLAFADPRLGVWRAGQVERIPVTDRVVALVDAGYLEPDWDGMPPAVVERPDTLVVPAAEPPAAPIAPVAPRRATVPAARRSPARRRRADGDG